jgi:hypothetical protein
VQIFFLDTEFIEILPILSCNGTYGFFCLIAITIERRFKGATSITILFCMLFY